jgi:dihydroorotase
MGASTGNMLVNNAHSLERIFREAPTIVAVHCEDENTIVRNMNNIRTKLADDIGLADIPVRYHPFVRNDEACYRSSAKAVELAARCGTRLHVLHLSSAKEMSLFSGEPVSQKKITAEVCVHHLWFDEDAYVRYGPFIKCNPAIKSDSDRMALRYALKNNKLDIVATDHAPHTYEEKFERQYDYLQCPSGLPSIQHSLVAMLELVHREVLPAELVVEKMCHAPAELFRIQRRGYIRVGYFADLVLVNPDSKWTVEHDNILYKCNWTPFYGTTFQHKVEKTFVNGQLGYDNGILYPIRGKALEFDR